MSKIAKVSAILHGSHVLGDKPLAAYHDAKACVNAMRRVGLDRQFAAVRKATKNYRVMVGLVDNGIRIYRPDLNQEVVLDR